MKWNKTFVLVLLICLSQLSYGQKARKGSDKPLTITGKVVNQNRSPIEGAVMYIDNMKTSIITRSDGSYKIKASPTAITLEVRSSQFGTCETPINGETTINFMLNGTGGIVSFAGDVSKDKGNNDGEGKSGRSKAKKMNTYTDIFQMIRAEVNGVVVSGRSVQIQQGHSFFGSGTPLFVINGVVVSSIDEVNPLEVKSIKALKGSEAAIWGVRGSNGVIDITLKNGTENN